MSDRSTGAVLLTAVARDAALYPLARVVPARERYADRASRHRGDALERAIGWLCRTHDVTGRHGSSKGFSLLHGWLPAYPETTGYVIGTLLEYAERQGNRPDLVERARSMGAWETEVQLGDGGVMLGHVGIRPPRSVVFNTGMVLHGWVDLIQRGIAECRPAAARAAAFLVDNIGADGVWRTEVEYNGLAHTYNSRVSWAMLRWAAVAGDAEAEAAGRRQLDWTLERQHENGWFNQCVFKAATEPSTHAIAYTLRGLLESHALLGEPRWLDAVLRTSEVLIRKLEVIGRLPATWTKDWNPAAQHECLTGTAQLGGVWLRLFEITDDARYLNAGLKALDLALSRQLASRWAELDGALPGSFPMWGRYAPLQCPNWAAKFLADSLMIRARAMP